VSTLYKVIALTGFRGHKQGDEFEADLTPDQERRAKARGSIRVVRRDKQDDEKEGKDA
jgi:hypothetical protein